MSASLSLYMIYIISIFIYTVETGIYKHIFEIDV